MRVWYPGPSVSPSAAGEAQLHSQLGRIAPGWNELADTEPLRSALAAGLVAAEPAEPDLPDHAVAVPGPSQTAWHSARSPVHHTEDACDVGYNIEPRNRKPGDGGKPLCGRCADLREKE